MASFEHGDEVKDNLDETAKLPTPPLFCGDPRFHPPHAFRLEEGRVVHGANFPAGLPAWCDGKRSETAVRERADFFPTVTPPVAPQPVNLPPVVPGYPMRDDGVRGDTPLTRWEDESRAALIGPSFGGQNELPEQPPIDAINIMDFDLRETPMFGICDDKGVVLLEFRLNGHGQLDARYYEDDLTEAALQFVKHIKRMAGRTDAVA